jgi:hypothetical protein
MQNTHVIMLKRDGALILQLGCPLSKMKVKISITKHREAFADFKDAHPCD